MSPTWKLIRQPFALGTCAKTDPHPLDPVWARTVQLLVVYTGQTLSSQPERANSGLRGFISPRCMKVKKLRLRNIRCFEDLTLELNGKSALVVGDNGDGKSTVLRSLAMGLCDESSASALFRDLYGESVREGSEEGTIEVELEDGTECFLTETTIGALSQFEHVDQKLYKLLDGEQELSNQASFSWEKIFATGYGPGVRVHGTADYDYYLAVDALYPLFVYDRPLQNPELVMRRLVGLHSTERDSEKILSALKELLQNILQLESSDKVELTKAGIAVKNRHGLYPLSSLGDGYHSTVTWVLDLLSWWYLRGTTSDLFDFTDIEGVVLIDEVEQHLHPRWQLNIMWLLTESFPNVQFLATTHSPLVTSGCEDIPVHCLNGGGHRVERPFGWRVEEVYEMMGLPTSRAKSFAKDLQEYQRMDDERLRDSSFSSKEKEDHFRRLRRRLEMMPGTDPVRLALELENLARFAKESSDGDS